MVLRSRDGSRVSGQFYYRVLKVHVPYTDVRPYGSCASARMMSDIHDWAGLALGFFVAAHLFLNSAWNIKMTRKIPTGATLSP
jgi:hypothetical protein